MPDPRYSYRRCAAIYALVIAVSWFALIGFVVSMGAMVNAVRDVL